MVDHVRLLQVLVEFARTIVGPYDLDDVLATLSSDVAQLLHVDGAGVMLRDADGVLRFVAASDDHIGQVERLQTETGEGPCVDAHTTGRRVLVDDLAVTGGGPRAHGGHRSRRRRAGGVDDLVRSRSACVIRIRGAPTAGPGQPSTLASDQRRHVQRGVLQDGRGNHGSHRRRRRT